MGITVHDVIEQVEQLSSSDQKVLFHYLQAKFQQETEQPEKKMPGLLGLYARPDLDLSFEDIEQAIHENSWESEIDEFYGN